MATSLNALVKDSKLDRAQTRELLNSLNALLALRPQIARIEANTEASRAIDLEILELLRGLTTQARSPDDIFRTVRAFEGRIRKRATPLPKSVDPDDFTRRISSLYLNDKSGCPVHDPATPAQLPKDYLDILRAGDEFERRHEYSAAISHFDRAIALAPSQALAYLKRAGTLCEAGKYGEALAWIERASPLAPGAHTYETARGQLLFRLGRFREASRALRVARARAPTDASLAWGEGESLRRAGACAEALAAFSAAIQLDPQYDDAYLSRAECYLALNKPALAVGDISTVIGLGRDNIGALERLAYAYRVLASDRTLSAQADYRSLADDVERKVRDLRQMSLERAEANLPTLDCSEAVLDEATAAVRCERNLYYVYFDRGQSYLTAKGAAQLERMIARAKTCKRLVLRITGYSDPGEDDFSQGKDLAASRSSFLALGLSQLLGRPGVYSMTYYNDEFVMRMSDEGGLLGIYQGSKGYDDRPVQGTPGRADERNQVANVVLVCEPQ